MFSNRPQRAASIISSETELFQFIHAYDNVMRSDRLPTRTQQQAIEDRIKNYLRLPDKGLNVRLSTGDTLLTWATKRQFSYAVKLILTLGADRELPDNDGTTALISATDQLFNEEIMPVLLEAGANPNTPGRDGITALHVAASNGDLESLQLLSQFGANPNITNADGATPLVYAALVVGKQGAISDFIAIMECLLLHKANPNIVDNDGWSVLHYLVREENSELVGSALNGRIRAVTCLLSAYANPRLKLSNHVRHSPWRNKTAAEITTSPDLYNLLSRAETFYNDLEIERNIPAIQDNMDWIPQRVKSFVQRGIQACFLAPHGASSHERLNNFLTLRRNNPMPTLIKATDECFFNKKILDFLTVRDFAQLSLAVRNFNFFSHASGIVEQKHKRAFTIASARTNEEEKVTNSRLPEITKIN